jgi:hypothetical protein
MNHHRKGVPARSGKKRGNNPKLRRFDAIFTSNTGIHPDSEIKLKNQQDCYWVN